MIHDNFIYNQALSAWRRLKELDITTLFFHLFSFKKIGYISTYNRDIVKNNVCLLNTIFIPKTNYTYYRPQ